MSTDWMTSLLEAAQEHGVRVAEPPTPPTDAYWTVSSGLRIHGLDWGREGNPPIICLHGGQQAHTWDFFALAMRNTFHVRAIELRGHGDSDWAPDGDYRVSSIARDIYDITVDQLKLPPFVLVGLSLGGFTSMTFAGTWPEALRGLVIIDIAVDIEEEGTNNLMQFMAGPDQFDDLDALVDRVHAFNPRRPKHQLRSTLLHNLRQQPDGTWTWKYDKVFRGGLRDSDQLINQQELIANVQRITVPTLIVRGEQSDILTPAGAERLAELIPGPADIAVVPGAGHSVMGDNPPAFERIVEDWLKKTVLS